MVWEVRPDLPDAATYRGHDGVRELFARFDEVLEDMWYLPQDYVTRGDRVAVQLRWGGRGKGSGVEFDEREETWLFTVKNGKVTRVKEFARREDAHKALKADR